MTRIQGLKTSGFVVEIWPVGHITGVFDSHSSLVYIFYCSLLYILYFYLTEEKKRWITPQIKMMIEKLSLVSVMVTWRSPKSLTIPTLVIQSESNVELTLTNLQLKSVTACSHWIQLIVRDSGDALAFYAEVTYVWVDRIWFPLRESSTLLGNVILT